MSRKEITMEIEYNASDVNEALNEIGELARAEAEQWDYLPKPPRKLKKRDHIFLKIFLPMLLLFVAAFCFSARAVFGKGWLKNIFDPQEPGVKFTLPIAELPQLDEELYQPDGRYTVEGVFEAVSPSIVTIESFSEESAFSAFGQGSGVIMSADGYILTNAHVIADADLSIRVRLKDGTEYSATVIGSDTKSDIAIIKIGAKDLPAAQFGDSDSVKQGEQVVAIGSPAGLEGSITTGIVSGVDRMIKVEAANISMSCIQIDAAINPGNSGGALINMWGQVIGITSSKLDAVEYDNIGFAIETSAAEPIIEQLMENGKVLGRPKIGITFYETSEARAEYYGTPAGLEIVEVSPDCDIANTELQPGDFITKMNGVPVFSSDDVYEIILGLKPGDEVTATVVRMVPVNPRDPLSETADVEFEIRFKLMEDTGEFVVEDTEE